MKRKSLWKVLGTGMLAFSLIVSPIAGAAAQAAEVPEGQSTEPTETEEETLDGQQENRVGEDGDTNVNSAAEGDGTTDTPDASTPDAEDSMVKEGGEKLDLDPMRDEDIPAVGNEGDTDYEPAKEKYADVEIPVWGYTEDATVYSVDVEWGAMTFQWENSSWDPETHMPLPGAGWKVYDSSAEKALDAVEHAINEIKVTNHSNAPVWATLAYKGETKYGTDGKFGFTAGTEDTDTNNLTAAAGTVPAYLSLATADNGVDGAAGTPTVAKAYFMPDGIADNMKAGGAIEKWKTIGTITVGIKTEQPKETTEVAP